MNLFTKWLLSSTAIIISAFLIGGVEVHGYWTAIWLAVLLGALNAIIKPILVILTLPINILSLGLFTFIINGLIIMFASSIMKGFEVSGFFSAILFSIILTIINSIFYEFFEKKV